MARIARRYARYPLEALAAAVFAGLFALLPVGAASAIGGWLGRRLGPLFPVTRRAERNITRAMPELAPGEVSRIIRRMWDNLGRVGAEYASIGRIARPDGDRVEIVNGDRLEPYKDGRSPCIFVSGHFSNWEVCALALRNFGIPFHGIYRAPNNPFIHRIIGRLRRVSDEVHIPKGARGARKLISVLARGGQVFLLTDQKQNDGIAVPFFGRDAMTGPAAARFALRFDCPVIPLRMERLGGCHFRLTVNPPVEKPTTNDRDAAILEMMTRINALFEDWVRERPDQWLWVHNRWPD